MYVYLKTDRGIWEVGFFNPNDGRFISESLWNNPEDASDRVHWLNGGILPLRNIQFTVGDKILPCNNNEVFA